MSIIRDRLFEFFLYFRLGNSISSSSKVLHIQDGIIDRSNKVFENPIKYDLISNKYKNSTILPLKNDNNIRICSISDTHDRYELITNFIPSCDILIHSGGIFMSNRKMSVEGSRRKLINFNNWLNMLPAKDIIIIGGNHDYILTILSIEEINSILTNAIYLCNSHVTIQGYTVYGTPVSKGIRDLCIYLCIYLSIYLSISINLSI
jgi:hypothetical protein